MRARPPVASRNWRTLLGLLPWFAGAGLVIAGLLAVSQYGGSVRGRVVQQGDAAIAHLMDAKDSLEQFDLAKAETDLQQASAEFKSANDLIPNIPGIASIQTGKNLLRAGGLLSDAGTSLGDALTALTKSGGVLNVQFAALEDALTKAQRAVTDAAKIVQGIEPSQLPEQYREQFTSLRDRLPSIQAVVDRAISTAVFLERMTGSDRPRRYLVLFANSSELRPTGGFPGSYGLLTFENGRVKDFSADDVYNPDGQIRGVIVPPQQLQNITPSWGMRDAAWWIDFPTSAKKVMQYWQKGGGSAVDGVLSIRPEVLAGILKITGPISLPAYDLVLTSDNVLTQLQLEVEQNKTATEPKQIIKDLAPLIMQRLGSASASQWASLLALFKDAMDARDVLMQFNDDQLEQFVADQGWNGAVKETPGDYLMVDVSNIKGAKTDAVTDTSMKLESWMDGGSMAHRLTLTRRNDGGHTSYGFYNKTNYSYVRVLVPQGSVLRGISGNDQPNNKPLMRYDASAFRDPDLVALESTYQSSVNGAITYQEAGKTGFGFWMKIEPGQTQAVQLEYAVPAGVVASDYHLYVQRQPGLDVSDFEFTLQKSADLVVGASEPALKEWPDSWRLRNTLSRDLDLVIHLK